jgi:hypothetical protein
MHGCPVEPGMTGDVARPPAQHVIPAPLRHPRESGDPQFPEPKRLSKTTLLSACNKKAYFTMLRGLFFAKPPSLCLNTPNFLTREVGREAKCLAPEPLVQPWRNLK